MKLKSQIENSCSTAAEGKAITSVTAMRPSIVRRFDLGQLRLEAHLRESGDCAPSRDLSKSCLASGKRVERSSSASSDR